MHRDTYIKLILKEFLKDPYLVSFIYQTLDNIEINDAKDKTRTASFYLRNDIQLLYPGLIKTAIFETIKYDDNDDLEPGYSFYDVKPLYNIKSLMTTPTIYLNGKLNSITIMNNHTHDTKLMKNLLKKRNRYHKNETLYGDGEGVIKGLWYDFENKEYINI